MRKIGSTSLRRPWRTSSRGKSMKKSTLVGRPLGPDTLVILFGTFRSAAVWAASQGLHLNQWTLIESCTPLVVFNRQGDHSWQAPGEVEPRPLAGGTGTIVSVTDLMLE